MQTRSNNLNLSTQGSNLPWQAAGVACTVAVRVVVAGAAGDGNGAGGNVG